MTSFFFPNNQCGIGNKVQKVDFDFVGDCTIAPTPPPIADCPLPLIVREPDIPCPVFTTTKSDIAVGYSGDSANCNLKPPSRVTFTITRRQENTCPTDTSCQFDAEIDIQILVPPPPCPDISVGDFTVTTGFEDQACIADGRNRFRVRRTRRKGTSCSDPGTCEFVFDLELVVPIPRPPCPVINVNEFYVKTVYNDECKTGPSKFSIIPRHRPPLDCNDTGSCEFDVDLEINVKIPRPPCPEISVTTFNVNSGYESQKCTGQNRFVITRRYEPASCVDPTKKDKCEFDVELEIFIPIPKQPCPEINISKFNVNSFYDDGRAECENKSRFEIRKKHQISTDCRQPDRCAFEVDLEIAVPVPRQSCPTIDVGTFNVSAVYEDCVTSGSRFQITRKVTEGDCNNPDVCDFTVDLEIVVPVPRIPCPEFNIQKFSVDTFYDTEKCAGGGSIFKISRRPVPDINCDDSLGQQVPRCEFDIELEIKIPIPPPPPCPDISINAFNVSYKPITIDQLDEVQDCNRFTITTDRSTGACGETTGCSYGVDLNLCIPIPTCPDLNVNSFKVNTTYADCGSGQNKFTITKNGTDGCSFDIDLEINIPIPQPPCPVFGTRFRFLPPKIGAGCEQDQTSWFKIGSASVGGGCCPKTCGTVFDLRIAMPPLPKFIETIQFIDPQVEFNLNWCTNDSYWEFGFNPSGDLYAGDCTRGASFQYRPYLRIDAAIPPMPCSVIDIGPPNMSHPIQWRAIDDPGEFRLQVESYAGGGNCGPCRWEIIPQLSLPRPCKPTFRWDKARSNTNPYRYTSEKELEEALRDWKVEVNIEVEDLQSCKYVVWTYDKPPLYVPCKKVEIEIDTASEVTPYKCKNESELKEKTKFTDITLSADENDACKFTLKYSLDLGYLPQICDADITIHDSNSPGGNEIGAGSLECVDADGEKKYRIKLWLDTAPCPTSGSGGSGGTSSSAFTALPGAFALESRVGEDAITFQDKTTQSATPTTTVSARAETAGVQTKRISVVTDVQLVDGVLTVVREDVDVLVPQ